MQDIEAFLALEVKKEIADRYFGSRKLIEDDSIAYDQRLQDIELAYLFSSERAIQSLAENYVGLPF